jgi:hypothetical protein
MSAPAVLRGYLETIRSIREARWSSDETYRIRTGELIISEYEPRAWIAYAQGDIDTASEYVTALLMHYPDNVSARICSAKIAAYQHQYADAMQQLARAEEVVSYQLTSRWDGICLMLDQAEVLISDADVKRAGTLLAECLSFFRNAQTPLHIAEVLRLIAFLKAIAHEPESSARLWGAADALRERIGAPMWPIDRAEYAQRVAAARAILPSEQWDAAWDAGRRLTWEAACDEATRGVEG